MNEDLSELKTNPLFWVVVVLTLFMAGVGITKYYLVNKVTDNVIQKLKAEYTPGPYGPSFDPDKVNPDVFRNKEKVSP
jgi:hypothetical protein